MICIMNGKIDCVSYLLSHGTDIDVEDADGYTALELAHVYGKADCAQKLIEHGADESSLQDVVFDSCANSAEFIEILKEFVTGQDTVNILNVQII